jgi:rhomboid protease GluP
MLLVAMLIGGNSNTSVETKDFILLLALLAAAVVLIVTTYRQNNRIEALPPIRLLAHGISLPRSPSASRSMEIGYEEITDLQVITQPSLAQTGLLIATARKMIILGNHLFSGKPPMKMLGGSSFSDHGPMQQCYAAIQDRIGRLPDGAAAQQRIDDRKQLFLRSAKRKTFVTISLSAAIFLVFGIELVYQAGTEIDARTLIALGANVPVLVAGGEWQRIITANLLHAGLFHLLFNFMALDFLGRVLERLIGSMRVLLIFLVSSVAGAAASALWARGLLSIGASTAVFGLLGAYAVLNWRHRSVLPAGMRQSRGWWIRILVLNAALPFLVPQIDLAAHVGGFAAGLAIALLIPQAAIDREAPPDRLVQLVTGLMVALFVSGITIQLAPFRPSLPRSYLLELAQQQQHVAPAVLNTLAWQEATTVKASDHNLAMAEKAAERAVAADPDSPYYLDTLATVCYRRHQLLRAISLERQALALDHESETYPSQLARFLRAHHEQAGILVMGGAIPGDARLSIDQEAETWTIELASGLSPGSAVYATVVEEQSLRGLLRVCKVPGGMADPASPPATPWQASITLDLSTGPEKEVTVALIDATGSDCRDAENPVQLWKYHPDIAALP